MLVDASRGKVGQQKSTSCPNCNELSVFIGLSVRSRHCSGQKTSFLQLPKHQEHRAYMMSTAPGCVFFWGTPKLALVFLFGFPLKLPTSHTHFAFRISQQVPAKVRLKPPKWLLPPGTSARSLCVVGVARCFHGNLFGLVWGFQKEAPHFGGSLSRQMCDA